MSQRTTPTLRGDVRRSAILEALDQHLQDSSFESINIAEISRAAGVSRSAFYFYFDNKATAVAALMEEMYDAAYRAGDLLGGGGSPAESIEAAIRGLFQAFDDHEHVYRAMLEARSTTAAVRDMWDADRTSFVPVVAGLIREERKEGRAPDGVDADVLADILLDLNDRMLERLARGGALARDQIVQGTVTVWMKTIYGGDHR